MLSGKVVSRLEQISKGSHMVLFYNSQKEKHQILFPFIEHEIEEGQLIIYLSGEQSQRQIVKEMSTFGIDVNKHEKSGALKIIEGEEWYVENGSINKESVVKKWMKALSDATKNGFCGLIFSGEPTYFFRHNILEPWMEYERSLPRRFEFPMTAICRYKTRDLASRNLSYLLELVKIHSHTITSTSIQEVDFQKSFLESVDNTFKRIIDESGTRAVYHFLENKHKLPKSSVGNNIGLFKEGLDDLFGVDGGNVLRKEVLKDICSKLGLICDLKNEHMHVEHVNISKTWEKGKVKQSPVSVLA